MKKFLLFGLLISFQIVFCQVSMERNKLVKDGVKYKFSKYEDDGYTHFEEVEKLPELKPNEQQILMKKAIIQYFIDEDLLEIS